jgi:hypothetical protein
MNTAVSQTAMASDGVRVAVFATDPESGNGRALMMVTSLAEAGYLVTLYTDQAGVALCPDGVAAECCLTVGNHDLPVALSRIPD